MAELNPMAGGAASGPGEVLVAPLSSSWPWVGCPDCGRVPGEAHSDTCGIHDEFDDGSGGKADAAVSYFAEADAVALVGRRYRATGGYSGVEAGRVGRVSGVYPLDAGRRQLFGVDVTWEVIAGDSPLEVLRGGRTDGFSRRDLFLVFTGGPNRGRRAMEPLDRPDGGPGLPGTSW